MLDPNRTAFDELRCQAMLYAAGEMDPRATEVFENKLGADPDAQTALVQAVQMAGLIDGRGYAPDPGYREVVRDALSSRRHARRQSRLLRAVGATTAAIALMTIALMGLQSHEPQPAAAQLASTKPITPDQLVEPSPAAVNAPDVPLAKLPGADQPIEKKDGMDVEDALGAAETWAELTNYDRLRKLMEYELRRKAQRTQPATSAL